MNARTFSVLRVVLMISLGLVMIRIGWMTFSELDKDEHVIQRSDGGGVPCRRDPPCPSHQRRRRGSEDGVEEIQLGEESAAQAAHSPRLLGEDVDEGAEYQVPNIVHYIWYNTAPNPLRFHHMLSILSAHKVLDPDVIYFHTNMEPTGRYWSKVKELPKLKIVYREPPLHMFGEKVKDPVFYTSHSNVDRVKVLMEHGGIYLDFDVLVTRPFDDLRKHVCTIGLERDTQACGSVIVCSRKAFFLHLWINSYLDDYRIEEWAYNTGKVPFNLAKRFPHLVHVERTRLNRPNFRELDQIWGPNTFDWHNNYAVHLWYRLWKDQSEFFKGVEPDEQNVKTLNNTFGEMARTILYGTRELMHRDA